MIMCDTDYLRLASQANDLASTMLEVASPEAMQDESKLLHLVNVRRRLLMVLQELTQYETSLLRDRLSAPETTQVEQVLP